MKTLVAYFLRRPLVCNTILIGVIIAALVSWQKIGKEEMPEFTMSWLRINLAYPGAAAEDVELFVSKPIEEMLKGVSGLYEIRNSSSRGMSTFQITLEPQLLSMSEKIQEIKDAVDRAEIPQEVEDPVYDQFSSAEKAIIDLGIYNKKASILTVEQRIALQEFVLSLQNQLLTLPEVSGVEQNAYLQPELQIKVDPKRLKQYDLSMAEVRSQVMSQNVRTPVGSMMDEEESSITLLSELETVEALEKVILLSGFDGQRIRLSEVAKVQYGFERTNSINKVQGKEAVILNIQKSISADIISAQKAVLALVEQFSKNHAESDFVVIPMDDESYDVRNRLSLIAVNGGVGFLIIVFILFVFLDFRSGLWVAMGIPFTLSFTIIAALLIGYTVNNITLAAIIIVLGIVVDDATIVAEDASRRVREGESLADAAANAATGMANPIIASILTTCAAFIPLFFFTGRFGLFVKYIPVVVALMLLASFFESLFVLPSHLAHSIKKKKQELPKGRLTVLRNRMISWSESHYLEALKKVLRARWVTIGVFLLSLGGSVYLFTQQMSFVMFPREETSQLSVRVVGPEDYNRFQMAEKITEIEELFVNDPSGTVTSVRTNIGQSRRGGQVRENEAFLRVELLAPDERSVSANTLIKQWEAQAKQFGGYQEVRFLKDRFGSDSGSPIAIEVQENNDEKRAAVSERLRAELEAMPSLSNVEIEEPVVKREFRLEVKSEEVSRLNIDFEQMASSLRGYVQGHLLYKINSGDEIVEVRLSSEDDNINEIAKVLDLRAGNEGGYLVPMKNLVNVVEGVKPTTIERTNFKRTVMVFADIKEGAGLTPLEVAETLEKSVFPKTLSESPSSLFRFRGEIEDSRESQGEFALSILLVILLIYILLVFLFDSLVVPLIIGAIIPFGMVGVVLAFYAHGMLMYGFFSIIGTLGMIGVVVNNAIIMVSRLEEVSAEKALSFKEVAEICTTRLRPVVVTTLTTVAGLFPTAYGLGGYDSMLAEMMLALGWGLLFGTFITLFLVPCIYSFKAFKEVPLEA